MSIRYRGAWSEQQVASYLEQCTLPLRIAGVDPDGFPRVISLWYRFQQGALLAVTHEDSYLAKLLAENPNVGFEISPNEPPYLGVRGHGVAKLQPLGKEPTLDKLLERYLGSTDSQLAQWLLSRRDEELVITIEPRSVFSWDYRERMADV